MAGMGVVEEEQEEEGVLDPDLRAGRIRCTSKLFRGCSSQPVAKATPNADCNMPSMVIHLWFKHILFKRKGLGVA
jgi:hypothetical protein